MDAKQKIALGLFFATGGYLLYKSKDEKPEEQLQGINIDASKLIDSVGNKLIANPKLRNASKNLAFKAITQLMGGE